MKIWEIYQAEILKPAHRTRNNYGYLIVKPEEKGNSNYCKFVRDFKSIDKVVEELNKSNVQADFPDKQGILFLKEGQIIRYRSVHEDLFTDFCSSLRKYTSSSKK